MSLLESTEPVLATGERQLDPSHSAIESRVRRMKIATVTGTIRVASLDTHEPRRDEHLRSPDFFDAAGHPAIGLRSTSADVGDDGRLLVDGGLELKGVAGPVELAGEFRGTGVHPDGSERVGLTLNGASDRTDFGLTWNRAFEAGGVPVGNIIGLELDVSAVKVA
jgi:polyisoprenoid-binding protein YceI